MTSPENWNKEMKQIYPILPKLALFLSLSCISTAFAEEPMWKWIPANPPMTLPTLIAKGGVLNTVIAGRASNYIPDINLDSDFTFGGFYVVLGGKLYRCFTRNGKANDDGNCSVAVDEGEN